MNRRIIAVVVALLLAAVGTFALRMYVSGADERALDRTRAVTVYVAAKHIPAGTTVQDAVNGGLLGQQRLPAASVPADAVTTIGQGLGSRVADADIQPGQVVLNAMFTTKLSAAAPLRIPAGQVAVSVQMGVPQAVAGSVQQGSQIAVFLTYPADAKNDPVTTKDGTGIATRMVLPRVNVLQIGTWTPPAATGQQAAQSPSGSTVLITVALPQAQAEKLIQAQAVGTLYLALLNSSSATSADDGLSGKHLFG